MKLKHYKNLLLKYSVDIVSIDGVADSSMQFDTNSFKKAEAKFNEYLEKEALQGETVQLWSRLKNDEDIEVLKESTGMFNPENC